MKMFTVTLECYGVDYSREDYAHADNAMDVYGMDWDGWQVVDVQEYTDEQYTAERRAHDECMYGTGE